MGKGAYRCVHSPLFFTEEGASLFDKPHHHNIGTIMIIPCNVGYALSVTMAVLIPIGTWMTANWRWFRTWRSSNRGQREDENEDTLAWPLVIILGQAIVATSLALLLGIRTHPSADGGVSGGYITAIVFLSVFLVCCCTSPVLRSTLCLIVPGFVLLAIYYNQCIEPLDYHGPMYILNIFTDINRVDVDHTIKYREYNGQVQVGFGSTWACEREIAAVWCEPRVRVKDCEFCSRDITYDGKTICPAGSRQDATACVKQNAYPDLIQWEDTIGWPKPNDDSLWYAKEVRPDKEKSQWPVGMFYGDCATCTAYEESEYDDLMNYSRRLRLAAICLIGIGVLVIFIDFLDKMVRVMKKRRVEKHTNPPLEEAEGVDEEEDHPVASVDNDEEERIGLDDELSKTEEPVAVESGTNSTSKEDQVST